MACEHTQETIPVWFQVRVPGDNKIFGPVTSVEAVEALLLTVVSTGVLEAVIEKISTGPQLVAGA